MPAPTTSPFGRDALELRYDGPIPPADPAVIGRAQALARARLFARLAAETRHEMAARRADLAGLSAIGDPRLREIGRNLAYYRRAGLAWRDKRNG